MINNKDITIYVDMDGVMADYDRRKFELKIDRPEITYPQSEYGFFINLLPIPDAIETVNFLRKHFTVYTLTAPSQKNPLCYTEKRVWIEKYFDMDFVDGLIISPHKELNKGEYLIDDQLKGRGQDKFEGKLLHFGSEEYPNWIAIKNYFIKKYNISN